MEFLNLFVSQLKIIFTNPMFWVFFSGYLTGIVVCIFPKYFFRNGGEKNG